VNVWLGFRIAALSAGVWSISLGFIRYSHNARPEIALAVFTAISLLSFYTAMNEDSRRRQYIFMTFFWLSFGLAMLAKGPAPLPLIAPAVFLYFLVFGEWKKISKCMPILGPVIFLLIVLPWPLMVWQAKPDVLSVWNREFIDRGTGDFASGDKSFFYYIPVFFALSAPWVGFVPGALFSIFYKSRWGQRHKPLVWLWLWFVSQIVVMSIIGGKRQHYILPAMPALCILVGIVLEDVVFTRKAHSQSDRRGYFIGHLAVIYGAIIFGPVYVYFNQPEIFAQVLIIDAGVLVVTAVITILFTSKHKTGAVVSIFAGYILIVMISYIIFVNPNDSGIQARRLAVNLRKIVKDEQLAAYKDVSGRVVFYFGKPIPVAGSVEEIEDYYNRSNYVIAFGDHIEELENNTDMHQMRYWQEGQMRQTGMEAAGLFHKSANGSEGPQPAESQP
jgi:4-amino-4-deoxy-L-arabinose transferase-like glycosyltransferase